jgi:AmmeMemoRadiSam system protein B/AmmeMemoRadiSam system protein A
MKAPDHSLFSILLVCCLLSFPVTDATAAQADDIRKPIWAGKFYPAQRSELVLTIDRLTRQAKHTRLQVPAGKQLKALILPHAGYVYSGLTAAHASVVLAQKQFDKVILLGPDHRVGFRNAAVSNVRAYKTPLGLIPLSKDAANLRRQADLFHANIHSDRSEHSLEVVLPFLQHVLGEFQLVPVVMGPGDIQQLSDAIDGLRHPNALLVVSSDLSHYLSYSQAVARDKETIRMILDLEPEKLSGCQNCACGKTPILVLLDLALRYNWQPVLLHYSNSGDTAGGRTKVVGYAAIAFYGNPSQTDTRDTLPQFTQKQGQMLLQLARWTLAERLNPHAAGKVSEALAAVSQERSFKSSCGTFVTLKKNGRLRGCIGNLTAKENVLDGVRRNAIKAAFHDPRFPPLKAAELEQVKIEVSVLTPPQPLTYEDSADLLAKLIIKRDGLIIRKGRAGATFLPQVWEQLPRPEEFLGNLCRKAGLPVDTWRYTKLDVWTYKTQSFNEDQ